MASLAAFRFAVGPHDHHAAWPLPAVGRGGQTCPLDLRMVGTRRLLHWNAQICQSSLQCWQLLLTLLAFSQGTTQTQGMLSKYFTIRLYVLSSTVTMNWFYEVWRKMSLTLSFLCIFCKDKVRHPTSILE